MARDSYLDGYISRTPDTDRLWSIGLGVGVGGLVAAGVAHMLWPAGSSLTAHALYIWSDGPAAWVAWIQAHGLTLRAATALIPAGLAGIASAGWISWIMRPQRRRSLIRHISGPQLAADREAEKIGRRLGRKEGAPGVRIHPGVPLPLARETKHLIYAGTTGSGKTQGFMHLLREISKRNPGARIMIHDTKGDYIESSPAEGLAIIGPTDARSVPWDIAADIRTELDAELIASVTIPETKEPFWSSMSRLVFVGMILHCMQSHGQRWGWPHLAALLVLPHEQLQQILIEAHPVIGNRLPPGKTAEGVLATVTASLSWIRHLAKAWPRSVGAFSVTRWVLGRSKWRTIIMQHYDESATLAQPLISAIVSLAVRRLLSLPDSKTREVWFLLDELPALPRLGALLPLLQRGRSKGGRVVIAYQSYTDIIDRYSEATTKTIESLCSASVFFRVPSGDTADHISDLIDETEDEVPQPTTQQQGDTSITMQTRAVPLVRPADVSGLPEPEVVGGVPGYLVVSGWSHVLRLTWPFVDVPKLRTSHKPAGWFAGIDLSPAAAAAEVAAARRRAAERVAQAEHDQILPIIEQHAPAPAPAHDPEPAHDEPGADAATQTATEVIAHAVPVVEPALLAADLIEAVAPVVTPAPAADLLPAPAPAPTSARKSKKKRLAERMLASIGQQEHDL